MAVVEAAKYSAVEELRNGRRVEIRALRSCAMGAGWKSALSDRTTGPIYSRRLAAPAPSPYSVVSSL
ncbi:MAG: hypothetical protein K0S35_1485 [Geminicoccaceae bacterium]|nr:hypothetical protein [Geminicoccaceae bacterium]